MSWKNRKMKNEIYILTVILLLLVSPLASATIEENYESNDIWGKLEWLFFGETFSFAGDTLCCNQCPETTSGVVPHGQTYTQEDIDCSQFSDCDDKSCVINYRKRFDLDGSTSNYKERWCTSMPNLQSPPLGANTYKWEYECYACQEPRCSGEGQLGIDECTSDNDCRNGYYCDIASGYTQGTCHQPYCGNNICEPLESSSSCPVDCGPENTGYNDGDICGDCGIWTNGECEEDFNWCDMDGICDECETFATCPVDCSDDSDCDDGDEKCLFDGVEYRIYALCEDGEWVHKGNVKDKCGIECTENSDCDNDEWCNHVNECEELEEGEGNCASPYTPSKEISIPLFGGLTFTILGEPRCGEPLTKKQFKTATDKEIVLAICNVDRNCNQRKGYIVDCVSQETAGVQVDTSLKDKIKDFFETTNTPGLCLATPEDGDCLDFIRDLGANWDFLDNECNSGYAIIGGIVLIFMLFMMMATAGGRRRN